MSLIPLETTVIVATEKLSIFVITARDADLRMRRQHLMKPRRARLLNTDADKVNRH
jgi:hypothetical protein